MALSECAEFVFELEENTNIAISGVLINQCDLSLKLHQTRIDEELVNVYLPTLAVEKNQKQKQFNSSYEANEKFSDVIDSNIEITPNAKTCIVLGTGGVGKTTISSAIAISRARVEERASSILATKQKVALLTVDPARRLGVALGLEDTASRESHLDASNFKIVSKEEANLSVFQLDAKKEFFELLKKLPAKRAALTGLTMI